MCVYDIKDKGRLGGEVGLGRVGEARREYWWIDVVKVYVVEWDVIINLLFCIMSMGK